MDRGAWWATVRGVTKSWKQLSDYVQHRFLKLGKYKNHHKTSDLLRFFTVMHIHEGLRFKGASPQGASSVTAKIVKCVSLVPFSILQNQEIRVLRSRDNLKETKENP